MWCVAALNAEYIRKMEDVLALYERPLDASEPVVCVDEKPVTLHRDVRSPTPAGPGQVARRDNEYQRCGTANVCKSLVGCYGEEFGDYLWKRFSVHYTPKHGSWLNQAEIEISLFSRQCLGRRRIPDLAALQAQAHAWNEQINRAQTRIDWQFSRKDARRRFGYRKNQFKRSEN